MDSLFYYSNNCIIVILMIACLCIRRKYFLFSWSTDVTSTDLVSAKGKTKEVYSCDSCFDRSILMFLMREGLQCRINISKHCLMRLWNDINQLTFVFTFFETRSIKRMWRQLTERMSVCVGRSFESVCLFVCPHSAAWMNEFKQANFKKIVLRIVSDSINRPGDLNFRSFDH